MYYVLCLLGGICIVVSISVDYRAAFVAMAGYGLLKLAQKLSTQ